MDTLALGQALAIAEQAASVRDAAATLRQQLAPLRVVVVDTADMRDEAPAARGARHDLYLGASDGHCWRMTSDLALAQALFIAERDAA
jgi:hypothetical protein